MKKSKVSYAIAAILILMPLFPTAYGEGPSFEVASIKTAPPLGTGMGFGGGMRMLGCSGGPGTNDPGRWTCDNMNLSYLVSVAFDLKPFQLQSPSSIDNERFSIAAKIPEGATKEQFRLMQQNLLIERFGLKFHFDKKEIQGYELIVAKSGPKFKESEPEPPKAPAAEASAVPIASPKLMMGTDGFPIMPQDRTGVIMTSNRARGHWVRATMESIAQFLQGQVRNPVTDATGLSSKYDLSLEWTPDPMGNAAPTAFVAPTALGTGGPVPAASEYSGPNIFTAVQEQLGLKLQPKKVPIDILVIDYVEKTPTEN